MLDKDLENKDIGLMIVGDEEIGGNNGSYKLSKIIKPEIILIGEPSYNKSIARGHRGILWVRLKKNSKVDMVLDLIIMLMKKL